ncbi:hypothetical protein HYZ82_03305 [Candidatus Nomurabacteria bacterium]|nr:hypothetical protein [Candidatus Nomurabacteria bacterium]
MSIPLILFSASLLSIITMIARKLPTVPKESLTENEQFPLELPYFKEVKEKALQNAKKHGYAALVMTLRWYIRGTNFLKYKYESLKAKIKQKTEASNMNGEKKEISKFLRIIGEYKHKIREIKHRISEEENL